MRKILAILRVLSCSRLLTFDFVLSQMKVYNKLYKSIFPFIGIIFILSCNNNLMQKSAKVIDIQGHRGCRGILPENTIPAFIKALELGVSTLELDVVITGDKKVLVSHEAYFNSEITTTPNGDTIESRDMLDYNLYNMTLDEIQKYDVGRKVHPKFLSQEKIAINKPSFKEMVNACELYISKNKLKNITYNIELKFDSLEYNPTEQEFTALVLREIKDLSLSKKCYLQSFHHPILNEVHRQDPKMRTVLLVGDKESYEDHVSKIDHRLYGYSPYYALVTKELVTKTKKDNLKLVPWTVNKLSDAQSLVALGVDGIITDYPNIINKKSVLEK
jgi:glycerophosphoryl diester phosphodiesterase